MRKPFSLGAMVTQHDELITHAGWPRPFPLIREAALQIADPQVRYMGTVGGNVANGDPGNDMPGLMQCLNATFQLSGPDGNRAASPHASFMKRPISLPARMRKF